MLARHLPNPQLCANSWLVLHPLVSCCAKYYISTFPSVTRFVLCSRVLQGQFSQPTIGPLKGCWPMTTCSTFLRLFHSMHASLSWNCGNSIQHTVWGLCFRAALLLQAELNEDFSSLQYTAVLGFCSKGPRYLPYYALSLIARSVFQLVGEHSLSHNATTFFALNTSPGSLIRDRYRFSRSATTALFGYSRLSCIEDDLWDYDLANALVIKRFEDCMGWTFINYISGSGCPLNFGTNPIASLNATPAAQMIMCDFPVDVCGFTQWCNSLIITFSCLFFADISR